MPRPRKNRRIKGPPRFNGFKPKGIPGRLLEKVVISIEEYECIRLADYEQLEHLESSQKMGVSRSVFTRMLDKARHKLSKAIIEGSMLEIEGGVFNFTDKYYQCKECYSLVSEETDSCPDCGSEQMELLNSKFLGNDQGG